MPRRPIILPIVVVVAAVAAPAAAITHGESDGNGHPAVVLIVADVHDRPAWRGSGTLVAPTSVPTTGHCVADPIDVVPDVRVSRSRTSRPATTTTRALAPNSVEAVGWAAHCSCRPGPSLSTTWAWSSSHSRWTSPSRANCRWSTCSTLWKGSGGCRSQPSRRRGMAFTPPVQCSRTKWAWRSGWLPIRDWPRSTSPASQVASRGCSRTIIQPEGLSSVTPVAELPRRNM